MGFMVSFFKYLIFSKKYVVFYPILFCLLFIFVFFASVPCFAHTREGETGETGLEDFLESLRGKEGFSLSDYYSDSYLLDSYVETIISLTPDQDLVSQLIITSSGGYGRRPDFALKLIEEKKVGGTIFFENSITEIKELANKYMQAAINSNSILLPLFSIDGEPTLITKRFYKKVVLPYSEYIESPDECRYIARDISLLLKNWGVHVNYAPVCDLSQNRAIIGNRSFGDSVEKVSRYASIFIRTTQSYGISATAKHFPGHGSMEGDTHRRLVISKGLPPELTIFQTAIDSGVIFVMVGHIAIEGDEYFDTNGKPSTLSRKIVTGLLRDGMGFKGIIITDAMTMRAAKIFDDPELKAIDAGVDMILMPNDELSLLDALMKRVKNDVDFRFRIMDSVRRIVRLKACLGLINEKALLNY